MDEQRTCETMFGIETGEEVHDFVARNAGGCAERCPLLDRHGESPLLPCQSDEAYRSRLSMAAS